MSKAKPGYKLVKSLFGKYEEIPEEWNYSRITTMLEKDKDIVAGPFGSNLKVSDYREQGVPIIRLQNIQRNNFIDKNIKFISNEKAKELSYHSYKSGDLVLAKLGDPIGKTCRIPKNFPGGIVVADVVRIRNSPKKSDVKFMEYILNSNSSTKQFNKEKIGSTRPRVNLDDVRNLLFFFPPLSEQQKIASILSTVDDTINKYDEIITQTKHLKQGLMQKLLTKGIGHKKFKKVKWFYGKKIEIPESWEIKKLKNIAKRVSVGHVGITSKFYCSKKDGVLFLRSQNVRKGFLNLNDLVYITKEFHNKLKKSQLKNGDLLIVRVGANRADSCIVSEDLDDCNCANIIFARLTNVYPKYVDYFFQSNFCKKLLLNLSVGAAQEVINTKDVQNLFVFIPPKLEQEKISSVFFQLDDTISDLELKKKSLESLKKGLMQKLLTGQLRFKPL